MSELTAAQTADLAAVAGCIVPASAKHGVPGADDPVIQADLRATLGRDAGLVTTALARLVELGGGSFAALDDAARMAVALQLKAEGGPAVAALARLVLQSYYRDDRVVRSLGLEPRAPFPKGHVLEPEAWDLLAPVRARVPGWRA